ERNLNGGILWQKKIKGDLRQVMRRTNSKVVNSTLAKRPRTCGKRPVRSLVNIAARLSKFGTMRGEKRRRPGATRGAAPKKRGAMRALAHAHFRTMQNNTSAKIRPRQFSPRSASVLFSV